jgi:DNA-binding transcriptional MocR family regulator
MPTLQSPTTTPMGAARREAIAAVVGARGLTAIEDDVYGHLPRQRPPPLAAWAPESVLLIGSLSKSIAPWLRVGWLRAPRHLAAGVRSAVAMSCWAPPPLGAALAARWIADGTAEAMLEWQRTEIAARQALARAILGTHAAGSRDDGLHLWVRVPDGLHPDTLQAAAAARGVRIVASGMFAVGEDRTPAIRLALGGPPGRDRLADGLRQVLGLLAGGALEEGVV